jgi:glycosyltransferase involved in cell wall biosynthesis
MSRKPGIYAIPAGWSGCAFWRMRKPLEMLSRVSSTFNIGISNNSGKDVSLRDVQSEAQNADIIVLQAPGHFDAAMIIKMFKLLGKKVVVDYDDYSFDLSPANPRYADLGTKECELYDKSGKAIYRWKDGENGFDLQDNIARYNGCVECVKQADMVTVTTEYLASKFRPINPNTVILPNSVDMGLWKPVPKDPAWDKQIRIGWFGGDSHFSDLWVFRNAVPKVLKKYPQAKLVLQAPYVDFWLDAFKNIHPDRVEWYPWADLRFYTLFLASRGFDIGMCPLEPDNEFNKCKSGIKMFEFGAFGVPSVCQNMLPYSDVVRHGENGLLASSEEEWVERLSSLIEDEQYRRRLGEAAFTEVNTRWNLEKNCLLWEQSYLTLLEGQNAAEARRSCFSGCS